MLDQWLGTYGNFDEGSLDVQDERLHLFISPAGIPSFTYSYEARSNHGYDLIDEHGEIIEVGETAIATSIRNGKSSSWQDWSKEHRDEEFTARRGSIRIVSSSPRILVYGQRQLADTSG